jgi:copper chaperone
MKTLQLTIDGMTCGHCVGEVTKALAGLKTVVVNRITVGQANISYNPEIITLQTITQTIRKAGYEARTPIRTE